MTVRAARLAIAVIVLSLAAHADDWAKQFTVSAKPELQVSASDARVSLQAWDKNQIDVKVHTTGVRIPDQLQVTGEQTGNRVRIDLHSSHSFCIGLCIKTIEVTIQVPKDSLVNVRTSDGRIEANDLSGDIRLRTGDGRISGRNLSGSLSAETSDGRIEIDGRFDMLHVRTGDGHVSVRANYGSKMSGEWSIWTGDGGVELELPLDLAADLDVQTGDGHIDSDLPVEVQGSVGRNSLRGKLNGGGPRLEVHTGDGSIRLRRVEHSL